MPTIGKGREMVCIQGHRAHLVVLPLLDVALHDRVPRHHLRKPPFVLNPTFPRHIVKVAVVVPPSMPYLYSPARCRVPYTKLSRQLSGGINKTVDKMEVSDYFRTQDFGALAIAACNASTSGSRML